MRLGIFGGTFDPVHFGHLINAQTVLEQFSLDKILFIPSKSPVHKKLGGNATGSDRIAMLKLAVSGNVDFEISRLEIDRQSSSYTIITLKQLYEEFPGAEFYLIIGMDSFNDFHTWKDYREILNRAALIVLKRPGGVSENDKLNNADGKHVLFADNPMIDISSSYIRERIRKGRPISNLVPPEVEEYILKKDLYKK